jgi:hypothetical protein
VIPYASIQLDESKNGLVSIKQEIEMVGMWLYNWPILLRGREEGDPERTCLATTRREYGQHAE